MTPRRARWLRGLAAAALVCTALCAAFAVQLQIDAAREAPEDQLLYLPNDKLLVHLTGGMHSVIADVLWLQTVQYTAREFHSQDHKFTWLEHMANTTVRLDPYFTGVYKYGATLMAAIGNDTGAEQLLRKGLFARPDRHEIPFEMAKIYMMNRREWLGATAATAYYLAWAGTRADDPERAKGLFTWSRNLQRQNQLAESSRQVWEAMYRGAADPMIRELAERNLALLEAERIAEALQEAAGKYAAQHGAPPQNMHALEEAGLIAGRPQDGLGGGYYIDAGGRVLSETMLRDDADRRRGMLQAGISRFESMHSRLPRSLAEMEEADSIPFMPKTPLPEQKWVLEPGGRQVRLEPPLETILRREAQRHGWD